MAASSSNRRIAKNAIFLYIRTFVVMVLALFTSRVTLHALGETDYGIYNVVGGIVVLFAFLNASMTAATQRFLNYEMGGGDMERVHHVFNISVLAHLTIALVILILGETVGLWFLNAKLNIPEGRMAAARWVYQFSVLGCCAQIVRVPYSASIIAYERMSFFAYASIIENILRLIIGFVLLAWGADRLVFYALLLLLSIVVVNVLYLLYCRNRFVTCRFVPEWDSHTYTQLMSFSGWSMVGAGSNVITNQGRSFIFNIFCGVIVNTALGLVHQIVVAVNAFYSSFQTAFQPQLVQSYAAGDRVQLYSLIHRSTRFSFFLALLVALPLICYTEPILRLWLGQVPAYTVPLARLFIVSTVIDSLSMPLWTTVQATGNMRNYQIVMSAITLLTLPVTYALLRQGFSPVFAVLVTVLLNVVLYILRIIFVHRLAGLDIFEYLKKVVFNITLVGLLSSIVPLLCLCLLHGTWETILGIALSVASTAIVIFFVGLLPAERQLLVVNIYNRFIKPIFRRQAIQ